MPGFYPYSPPLLKTLLTILPKIRLAGNEASFFVSEPVWFFCVGKEHTPVVLLASYQSGAAH